MDQFEASSSSSDNADVSRKQIPARNGAVSSEQNSDIENATKSISTVAVCASPCSPLPSFKLTDLPLDAYSAIIKTLVGSWRCLYSRTLERARDAYAFSINNRSSYYVFRSTFDKLHFDYKSKVNPHSIARLFGASLRHLSTDSADIEFIICTLQQFNPHLESLALLLRRDMVSFRHTLPPVLASSAATLRSLRLEFISWDSTTENLARDIAPSLRNLFELSLEGKEHVTHYVLLTLLQSPGKNLRRLELINLDNRTVNDRTLELVKRICTGLESIDIRDVPYCTKPGVRDFVMSYGRQLRELDCFSTCKPCMGKADMERILSSCTLLERLSIGPQVVKGDPALEFLAPLRRTLRKVRFTFAIGRRCMNPLPNLEKTRIGLAVPNIRELSLAGTARNNGFDELCTDVGSQLYVLNLNCFAGNSILNSVRKCRNLRELSFGYPNWDHAHECTPGETIGPTCTAISDMLKDIGKYLRRFSWYSRFCITGSDGKPVANPGADFITGASLARSLMNYCARIEVVYVTRLKPSGRAELDEYNRAFSELELKRPRVTVLLDTSLPFWLRRWFPTAK